MKNTINEVIHILDNGGVILYPTDTVWGLGCDALNKKAVSKLFKIKKRMEDKSVITLVKSLNNIESFVEHIPEKAKTILLDYPTPQTVIFPKGKNLPLGVLNQNQSVAFRIPKHAFCSELLSKFKKPLVSTSANISGEETPNCFEAISNQILTQVDYIVPKNFEENATKKPSQINLITKTNDILILRK